MHQLHQLIALWLASTSVALAGVVQLEVEVGPDGTHIRDAIFVEGLADDRPGPIDVRDVSGRVLRSVGTPDPRHRSIAYPDGTGDSAVLERGVVSVRVDWPDGADHFSAYGQVIRPRPAPPPAAIPVLESGAPTERLDLVFLGDGYTDQQDGRFANHVNAVVEHLLEIEPFNRYQDLFNVWRVPIGGGGSIGQNGAPASSALGCYYGCGGIERLVCCNGPVVSTAAQAVPGYDGVLVLVNDTRYGGSGGVDFAVSYTGGPFALQVAAHEMGHTLFALWDEYSYGTTFGGGNGPNCAANANDTPWEDWVGTQGVGAFATCSYTNYYRPTDGSCMMNFIEQPAYCPVCREHAVRMLHSRIPTFAPNLTVPPGTSITLVEGDERVDISFDAVGDASRYTYAWTLNGEVIHTGASLSVRDCSDYVGELSLEIRHETAWVRSDPRGDLIEVIGPWYLDTPGEGCASSIDELFAACGCATSAATLPATFAWALLLGALSPLVLRRRAA